MKTISIYIRQILFICLICFGLVCYGQGQVSRPTNPQTQTSKPKKAASEVKISAPDGYINGHGYVDLGLPSGLKWAYSNLGATTPNEDGDRYARGEVKPKKSFTAENYEFVTVLEDGTQQFGKYPNPYQDEIDLDHDAAHYSRGETWRLPSSNDWEELCVNCTAIGVVYRGKKGMLFTSKHNGKTIFLPLTPVMYENGRTDKNSGDYWSSSTGGNSGPRSFYIIFSRSFEPRGCSSANPILGRAIRAVAE